MAFALNQLGQVSLSVDDVNAAERFYGETLGLRKLYRFGGIGRSDAIHKQTLE